MDKWEWEQHTFYIRGGLNREHLDLDGVFSDFMDEGWEVVAITPLSLHEFKQPDQDTPRPIPPRPGRMFDVRSVIILFRRHKK